jgi:2-polyprenyl-6-methoxyphenol hydroxylase-like FAD-dependent oxidoreductase
VEGIRYALGEEERELRASCVVGADGPGSRVRQALGVAVSVKRAPDSYVLGMGRMTEAFRFGKVVIYCAPGWHDGLVPTTDGVHFWDHVTDENRAAVEARDLEGWRDVFSARIPMGRAIVEPIERWDELAVLTLRRMRAAERVVDGAVLIGDAAGTVHPAVGQGANIAIEDAVRLGEVLAAQPAGEVVRRSALEGYARERGKKLTAYQIWSYFSAGCLDTPSTIWRFLGVTGLRLSVLGPVRRRQLRWSAGLAASAPIGA